MSERDHADGLARTEVGATDDPAAMARTAPGDDCLRDGDRVGDYLVRRAVGRGGFGTVYEAVHPVIDKRVAIKVLHREHGVVRDVVERFVDEARAVNRIRHRGIVEIFGFGCLEDGRHWCAMDLLEGQTLEQRMAAAGGRIGVEEVLEIGLALADALDAAHSVGVVHRDVKPQNVFLGERGEVKLLDFGIAKLRADTSATGVIGTPLYMAPEQYRGRGVGPATDVYALGGTIYHALTGRPPHHAESAAALMYKHLDERPEEPSRFRAELRAADDALLALLAKDPGQRPRPCREAVEAIAAALRPRAAHVPDRVPIWVADDPRLRPHPEARHLCVGREVELAAVDRALLADPPRICALQGMAGVGKSYVVDAWWHRHEARFPGGYVRLVLEGGPRSADQLRDVLIDQLGIDAGRDPWATLRDRLCHRRSLLHIENLDRDADVASAIALIARLSGAAIVVTGRLLGPGTGRRDWIVLTIDPLTDEDARELLRREAEIALEPGWLDRFVARAGGLPLALHLIGGYLRAGFAPTLVSRDLARQRYRVAPYDPGDPLLVADERRAVLRDTIGLSLDALGHELVRRGEDATRLLAGFTALAHAPAAGFGERLALAISGLSSDELGALTITAVRLSCLQRLVRPGSAIAAWRMQPLLREIVASATERALASERLAAWCRRCIDGELGGWAELAAEPAAIVSWLDEADDADLRWIAGRATEFALRNGPYLAWARAFERAFAQTADDRVAEVLVRIWVRAGATEPARQLAEQLHRAVDPHTRALGLGLLGELALERGALVEAADRLARGAADLQEAGDPAAAARMFGRLVELHIERADLAAAERAHAEELAATESAPLARADTALHGAALAGLRGDADRAVALCRDQVAPVFASAGDRAGRADVHRLMAELRLERGDYGEALTLLNDEVIPTLEDLGDTRRRVRAIALVAQAHASRGDLAGARALLEHEVVPATRTLGEDRLSVIADRVAAEVAAVGGDLERAAALHRDRVLPALRRLGAHRDLVATTAAAAEVMLAHGEVDGAERLLVEDALPIVAELASPLGALRVDLALARVYLARGDIGRARTLLVDQVLPASERVGDLLRRALALGALAELAYVTGDFDEAIRLHRDEELPIYERIGDRRAQAITHGQIADALDMRGDGAAARALREERELPTYRELGDLRSLALATAKLANTRAAAGATSEALALLDEDVLPLLRHGGDRRAEAIVAVSAMFLHLELGDLQGAAGRARMVETLLARNPVRLDPAVRQRIAELVR